MTARPRPRRRRRPTPAVIVGTPVDETTIDPATGAVRSAQTAELVLAARALEEIWTPAHLERLARTYWRFLARVTGHLVTVRYAARERRVVALGVLPLLVFGEPEYELGERRGLVRWRIERGLLVSRAGRGGQGHLEIEVVRLPADPGDPPGSARLRVAVEVASFHPSIASAISRRAYEATQSRLHVLVTRGFLRSLERLDLAPSRVGRFA
ncbi:MAG TPA: hypothetical protein VHB30_04470 [Solirubrobacteraceae bacterium]|nr:hypothetical protein [Solirubrobacteraceae bacterium]